MEKLEELQNRLGHKKYADLIEELADLALKNSPRPVAVEQLPISETRHVPTKLKAAIWQRDQANALTPQKTGNAAIPDNHFKWDISNRSQKAGKQVTRI